MKFDKVLNEKNAWDALDDKDPFYDNDNGEDDKIAHQEASILLPEFLKSYKRFLSDLHDMEAKVAKYRTLGIDFIKSKKVGKVTQKDISIGKTLGTLAYEKYKKVFY